MCSGVRFRRGLHRLASLGPDALYAKLEAKAKKEKRSVSNMAQVIIEEALTGVS